MSYVNIEKHKSTVAILMCVRDEQTYIDLNIAYHLDIGFDYIFIANHCSKDKTTEILESYKEDPRVVVVVENDPVFDHAKIANKLLTYAKSNYTVDWFLFLDADEFFTSKDGKIHTFVSKLEEKNIPYATIGWANALFDHSMSDYTCAPAHAIDTMKFFYPWPEKKWQEHGHFRKTLIKDHKNLEIVVGGHFVKSENNPDFLREYYWNPFIVPEAEAKLLHFEFRNNAQALYDKWSNFSMFKADSVSSDDAPWHDRIHTIRQYTRDYKDNIEAIKEKWFVQHHTLWGTPVPKNRIVTDTTLILWYRKYFRNKVESGTVKSICLVRSGHLGDVIMTEPVARFLSQFVDRVYLATEVEEVAEMIGTYDGVYKYKEVNSAENKADISIKLVHELSDNTKSYIQGYMESVGYGEVNIKDIPILKGNWSNIVQEDYFLIAPFTSKWQEQKRNWGYGNYIKLGAELEKQTGTKAMVLEHRYSFNEMISLIKHCRFLIGGDSAPAVIAQSFEKKNFILFGATNPKYLHLSEKAVPIYNESRHAICNHKTRQDEIECCEEFCMQNIRPVNVLEQIKENL